MANISKETLRAQARELAHKLGGAELPGNLDEMKQEPLLVLVAELEAKLPKADNAEKPDAQVFGRDANTASPPAAPRPQEPKPGEAKPEEAKPEEAKPEAPKRSESGRYVVAEGKMLVCLKGPVGAFQEIRAIDLGGGEVELEALVAAGTVVPAKR